MSNLPTSIGKYQIIREIARSNDIVYEAYDPLMDRRVALKELNLPGGTTEQQRQDRIARFERECRAAGRLAHPNIMTVYEFGQEGNRTFMAMEFLDGNTLRNEIDTKGQIPTERAIEIAKAVLAGLEHAHSNGVVHRDIKPDNIQLTTRGIKITDFGIARLTFQPNLTIDGQVFGTPSYMSPEQVRGGEIDARSDVFSLGVVLYEVLSGKKPFEGDSVITITYAILNKEPDMPPAMGFALWRVIERALDKSPQLRWSSAKEFSAALDEAVHQQATGVIPMGMPTILPGFGSSNPTGTFPTYVPQTPYGAQPVPPPPITYPYNPYHPQPHQTGPIPPGFQLPTNLPIYYPPPPRKPLLTPEQSALMRRVGAIVFVLATFFGTVIMAILYFTGVFGTNETLPSRVPNREEPVVSSVVDRTLAQSSDMARGYEIQAESSLARANEASDLATVDTHLLAAAESFENAANIEPEAGQRRSVSLRAADAYLRLFRLRQDAGLTGGVLRAPLYGAVRTAPDGTEIARQAKAILDGLS